MKLDPDSPARADQRLIRLLLRGDEDLYTEHHGKRLSQIFVDRGGSWTALFLGSTEDMKLFKSILKEFVRDKKK